MCEGNKILLNLCVAKRSATDVVLEDVVLEGYAQTIKQITFIDYLLFCISVH
jgi:hypothetical protein